MLIGLDVGGTHTDAVLIGPEGIVRKAKVPTNHENLLESVSGGLAAVTEGLAQGAARRAVLSTTLTTNCIAEGKLAPVGVIVSAGPGVDPAAFCTGAHYYAVSGSIDHRGREIKPVNASEIEAVAARLREGGVRQVAIVSKFSVRNPRHELEIRRLLGEGVEYAVMGHQVSGNLNFPRRIATAYLNAAVHPVHGEFYSAVRRSLAGRGLDIPLAILKADGGTMSLKASLVLPGQSILSGPAASVMGSLPFAAEDEETLVMDMGGTTTDMAVLVNETPLLEPLGCEVGGFRTLIRALRTRSIALGGDSALRVANGGLTIGPDRLGRAMGYGGPAPTPTDALCVLGASENCDCRASREGLAPLAAAMNMSLLDFADLVFDTLCRRMLDEAAKMVADINGKPVYTIHELLHGYKVNPRDILILGGPAKSVAPRLQQHAHRHRVRVVPEWQVANAIGAALARATSEVSLFADTERGVVSAPEEDFYRPVKSDFTREDALDLASELLRDKALREGAEMADLELEVVEDQQFNMVQDFETTGKNIRVKVQVKPGLTSRYGEVVERLGEMGFAGARRG